MKRCLLVGLVVWAILLTSSQICLAKAPKTTLTSSKQTANQQVDKTKKRVQDLGIGQDVTVILTSGKEYYGSISSIKTDGFDVSEVDLKQQVSISYSDVKKIIKNYGNRGFMGKRINSDKSRIARIGLLGGAIIVVIIAVVALKGS